MTKPLQNPFLWDRGANTSFHLLFKLLPRQESLVSVTIGETKAAFSPRVGKEQLKSDAAPLPPFAVLHKDTVYPCKVSLDSFPHCLSPFLSHGKVSRQKDPQLVTFFCYKTFNVNLQYNVNLYEKNLKYTRFLQETTVNYAGAVQDGALHLLWTDFLLLCSQVKPSPPSNRKPT